MCYFFPNLYKVRRVVFQRQNWKKTKHKDFSNCNSQWWRFTKKTDKHLDCVLSFLATHTQTGFHTSLSAASANNTKTVLIDCCCSVPKGQHQLASLCWNGGHGWSSISCCALAAWQGYDYDNNPIEMFQLKLNIFHNLTPVGWHSEPSGPPWVGGHMG